MLKTDPTKNALVKCGFFVGFFFPQARDPLVRGAHEGDRHGRALPREADGRAAEVGDRGGREEDGGGGEEDPQREPQTAGDGREEDERRRRGQ